MTGSGLWAGGVLHLAGARDAVYYIPMTQPKKPPVSFRPGDERLARIDAYAKQHALSRHLAILVLIDAGLGGAKAVEAKAAPVKKPVVTVKKVAAPVLTFGPVVQAPGSRLKKR